MAVSHSARMVRIVTVRTRTRFLLDRLTFLYGARALFFEIEPIFLTICAEMTVQKLDV